MIIESVAVIPAEYAVDVAAKITLKALEIMCWTAVICESLKRGKSWMTDVRWWYRMKKAGVKPVKPRHKRMPHKKPTEPTDGE